MCGDLIQRSSYNQEYCVRPSQIVLNFTHLRLLEKKSSQERTNDLMWHWINQNARVGDLLKVLSDLKLLRARDIILAWRPDFQATPCRGDPGGAWRYNPPPPPPQPPPPPFQVPGPSPAGADQQNIGSPSKNPNKEWTAALMSPGCTLKSLPPPFSPPSSLLSSSVSGSSCSSSDGSTGISQNTSRGHSQGDQLFSRVSALQSPGSLVWPLKELLEGTKNFSQSQIIGEGGFGHVYKANMRNTDYAVKKLKKDAELEWSTVKQSFLTEVEKLSGLRHPNIIDLAGYCVENDVYCLVYIFLPSGSLEDRLHCQGRVKPLSWSQRLAIMLGVARAIQFLHLNQPSLIHGDVKSSNILLDEQLTPKLGDFGLARFRYSAANAGQKSTAMFTKMVRGTLAYLPDEYVKMGKLTLALDTYSFGVVLLESLTGRPALQSGGSDNTKYLKDVVKEEEAKDQEEVEARKQKDPSFCVARGDKALRTGLRIYRKYMDSRPGQCPEQVGTELCQLACQCLDNQKKRPRMQEVYEKLDRLHSLLRCIPGENDISSSQDATSVPAEELLPPVDMLGNTFKDMLLTPEENTFKYSPGWPGCAHANNQPIVWQSEGQSGRTTGSGDPPFPAPNNSSLLNCAYPAQVHLVHGSSPQICQRTCMHKMDRFLGVTVGGNALRTLADGQNQPVESDESVSYTCGSLSSPYEQRASPATPDSGQGRSLSPACCRAVAVRRHSREAPIICQHHSEGYLPTSGQYCCHLKEGQEPASSLSQSRASDSRASASSNPGAFQDDPPREIIINPAKEKFVQLFAQYAQGNISSLELLNSGSNPGLPSLQRGGRTPEESDEYNF
ncbi:hypothetical protein NDU88_000538 [Pleurodeles waltl]|uniref:Protein kinase domain-containing protein n=1 Tax=Pleurodeles waltl TaxID=8319 RepID=A0AAV7M0I3_PLEWA|nr:hypothetical protein NDU88_000538 [Pleurodeles waltl]